MPLIRQVWLLIVTIVTIAFAAATAMSVLGARNYLQTQLTLKNNDNAQALAMALGQQGGDATLLELTLAAQFDTGAYRAIRLVGADGRVLVAREAPAAHVQAPDWFARWVPIHPARGVAQVAKGWAPLGQLELESHVGYALDELWQVALRTAAGFAGIAAVAMVFGWLGARGIKRRLEEVVQQARALHERRYHEVPVPRTPELRRVAEAMNALVGRVRSQSEQHAQEVEHLRRSAHDDRLTGVAQRSHFMIRLSLALQGDAAALGQDATPARAQLPVVDLDLGAPAGVDADPATASAALASTPAAGGVLVLVRLMELTELNRLAGHAQADAMLRTVAQTLQQFAEQSANDLPEAQSVVAVGRLNASDFGLIGPPSWPETRLRILPDRLRRALASLPPGAVAVSVVAWRQGMQASELLALADAALARAEAQGPFGCEFQLLPAAPLLPGGEEVWRYQLVDALSSGTARLREFPLRDRAGGLIHRECPLQLQLRGAGDWVSAAQWLPLAMRTGLTARVDELALQLALQAVAQDGVPRGINMSALSLRDPGFVPRMRDRLGQAGRHASRIFIEVDEAAAAGYTAALAELCRQIKPAGVRIGLEHAGERVAPVGILLEAGLDFVKLDGRVGRGVAANEARAVAVRGMVAMLHGLGLQVYAEGIDAAEDIAALWACGLDGVTGPAVTD